MIPPYILSKRDRRCWHRSLIVLRNFTCRICSQLPRQRQTTDERGLLSLIGLSPLPGTPEAALSLRKYHYNRYFSSLFSEAVREFSQRAQLLRKGAVPRECRLSLSPDNNGNVSVAGIFNFVKDHERSCFVLSSFIGQFFAFWTKRILDFVLYFKKPKFYQAKINQ